MSGIAVVIPTTRERNHLLDTLALFYSTSPIAVHLAVEGVNDADAVRLRLQSIEEPFVAWSGDDDFYSVAALQKQAAWLKRHPEYIACNGRAVTMDLMSGGVGHYPMRGLHSDSWLERACDLAGQYFLPQFSLFRTEELRGLFDLVGAPDRTWSPRTCQNAANREALFGLLAALRGKIGHINALSIARGTHKGQNQQRIPAEPNDFFSELDIRASGMGRHILETWGKRLKPRPPRLFGFYSPARFYHPGNGFIREVRKALA